MPSAAAWPRSCAASRRHGLKTKPNGKPRAPKTVKDYTLSIDKVLAAALRRHALRPHRARGLARPGDRHGRRAALRAHARGRGGPADPVAANRHVACLSAAFRWAISEGLTTYNPCAGVARNAEDPRDREPLAWEVECLRAMAGTLASPLMGLLMDFEAITGWRVSDVLNLDRRQCTAEGIRLKQGKRGKRQLWAWSDELRRIVRQALELPGARRAELLARGKVVQGHFPLEPIFPSRSGKPLTLSGFESNWQRLRDLTNAALAEAAVPLAIDDLHFHDLRSKAGDDADDLGFNVADFLGNDPAVAERHYARREKVVLPLDELRKRKAGA
jgi:hypothetical protein